MARLQHCPCAGAFLRVALAAAATAGVTAPAAALPGDKDGARGLALAKSGDCVAAVPLLEAAESARHRPQTASALAGCRVVLGELIRARDLYRDLASEKVDKTWGPADRKAYAEAPKKAEELDARIPTVEFVIDGKLPAGLSIRVGEDSAVENEPIPIPPDEKIPFVASAPGYDSIADTLLLHEGERKQIPLEFRREGTPTKPKDPEPSGEGWPAHAFGARFRGYLIPTFLMNIVAEGGTTVFEPGAGLTYTHTFGRLEVVPSIAYAYYGLPATPFKANGKPDTEWEIAEADLQSLALSVELFYVAPLDARGVVRLRVGAGLGIGWMMAGDLVRTQAYPKDLVPGDPYTYAKCNGPNDPAGTYRYCNSLDKDKTRYGEADRAWGDGGARPIIYPWIALPEVGLSFWPDEHWGIDVDLGLTISGFMGGVGGRYAF